MSEAPARFTPRDTARMEAFSDGVFAIAVTLLVLEFRVPEINEMEGNADLAAKLIALWPSLLAFAMSFYVILVMWVNHHELFTMVRKVDYPLFFANGAVLLTATFVPFPTAVLARSLTSNSANVAAAFYCASFLVACLSWNVLLASIIHRRRLLRPEIPARLVVRIRRAYTTAPFIYALSVVLAFRNAWLGLALCASLWILWMRLRYTSRREGRQEAT